MLLHAGHQAVEVTQSHSPPFRVICHFLLFVASISFTTITEFYAYFQVAGENRY